MNQARPSPKVLSNRSFGLIFAGIFLIVALFPLLGGGEVRRWATYIAIAFSGTALITPVLLTPLNRAWAAFGQVMHKITNPLLMGLVFFLTVVPTGLILKILGKDPMQRKLDHQTKSYWVARETNAITKESFDDQF